MKLSVVDFEGRLFKVVDEEKIRIIACMEISYICL